MGKKATRHSGFRGDIGFNGIYLVVAGVVDSEDEAPTM